MEPKKIFLDMDGVLADFNRGIKELCKMEPLDQTKSNNSDDDKMWEAVRNTQHFYDKLEIIPGSKELFDYLIGKYGNKVEILTGVPKEHRGIVTAGDDKIAWVRRLLSKDIVINIVHREDKPDYCKGKEYILIDDYSKNINEWEAIGGTGILFENAKQAKEQLSSIVNG
ncbi:MAG: hypothetical protein K5644_06810 [Lachnospiraceae bacterium]|nr:hypothetical protein [Lachnospiraceae bacterium]